ncbi:hypothetical protein QO010_002934 [Caulobacter ginsengisoli]|uniref:F5/8 type C domain-containing protein n=1 Tax=Caulobacter ginsengisoli TaxID=400775 RepID=A0ABU0IUU7_9CAUL|nr:hypothetical protein [Caulobacter ginsengisoli]MDQ0465150.1 hypothetical protein [Caulobacter ginsengisoli]
MSVYGRRAIIVGLGAAAIAANCPAPAEAQPLDDLNASMNDWTWVERSVEAEDLAPRFGFYLHEAIYVGDPNDEDAVLSGANDKPIALPTFARKRPTYPTAAEAEGHEAELAAYYRTVLAMTGQPAEDQEQNFWLDLGLYSEATQVEIPFVIWTRLSDMAPFSQWVVSGDDGSTFNDLDQGWQVKGKRIGGRIHLQHSGFDQGGEFANVSVSRVSLADRLATEEARMAKIIGRLRDLLGIDPWS